MAPHSSILPGKSHGLRSLASYSLWGHKESDTTEVTKHACKYIIKLLHMITLNSDTKT